MAVIPEKVWATSCEAVAKPAARVNCQHATQSPPHNASKKTIVLIRSPTGHICQGWRYHGSACRLETLSRTRGNKVEGAINSGRPFNARCRPAEVLVEGKRAKIIRRREAAKDLLRGDVLA